MLNNEAGMLESFLFQMHHLHTDIHTYPTTLPALTLIILIFEMLKFSEIVSFIKKKFVKEIIESSRIFYLSE